ncbi:MAG: DUF885 domain-containing protein [Planctomycetota bacterium]|nr:DUF885 domain-containing protein [Planctomycetota bacterium]
MTPSYALLPLLLLASCAGRVGYQPQAPRDADARFARFLREVRLARLDRDPSLRRLAGLEPLEAYPVLASAEREEERALTTRELARLTAFSPTDLGIEQRLDHRLLRTATQARLASLDWIDHAPITHPGSGALAELEVRLLAPRAWESEQHLLAWIDQVQAGAAWLKQANEVLRDRERRGLAPSQRALTLAREEAAGWTEGGVESARLVAHLVRGRAQLAGGVDPLRLEDLVRRARVALDEELNPALSAWHATIEDLVGRSTGSAGAWSRPDGAAWYAHELEQGTSLPMSAGALHLLAREEVDRVEAAMRPLLAQVDHPGSVVGFLGLLRTDERFRLETAAARERVARTIGDVQQALDKIVTDPPELTFDEAPPEGMGAPQLFAWTITQGLPGRALREGWIAPRSPFRENLAYLAWSSGWDVYVASVVLELGLTEDPYEQVALLERELWHAALLVADTGMHHERWSLDQASDYLERTTAAPREQASAAVDELLLRPGSAAPAVVGYLRFQELQRRARTRLGSRFDLAEFHRFLLALGPLPMNVLEEQVAAWGTRTLRRPAG